MTICVQLFRLLRHGRALENGHRELAGEDPGERDTDHGQRSDPTLIEGLVEIEKRARRTALRGLKGKIRFELPLEDTRR